MSSGLRRENRILAEERDILNKAVAFFAKRRQDSVTVFEFIAAKQAEHSVKAMCRVLGVSPLGLSRLAGPRALGALAEDARLTARIRELFVRRRQVYGSLRIWSDLVLDDGERISRKRVERLMRQAGPERGDGEALEGHHGPRPRRSGRR